MVSATVQDSKTSITELISKLRDADIVAKREGSSTHHFDTDIACLFGNTDAAIIFSKIAFWQKKEGVGRIENGIKYIYNSYRQWKQDHFKWLSTWQIRKGLDVLRKADVLVVDRLKAKRWDQTNHYSIDFEKFAILYAEYFGIQLADSDESKADSKKAETTEISELCNITNEDVTIPHVDVREPTDVYTERTNREIPPENNKDQDLSQSQKDLVEQLVNVRIEEILSKEREKNKSNFSQEEEGKSQQEKKLPSVDREPTPGKGFATKPILQKNKGSANVANKATKKLQNSIWHSDKERKDFKTALVDYLSALGDKEQPYAYACTVVRGVDKGEESPLLDKYRNNLLHVDDAIANNTQTDTEFDRQFNNFVKLIKNSFGDGSFSKSFMDTEIRKLLTFAKIYQDKERVDLFVRDEYPRLCRDRLMNNT